jgi:hypothetical protein
MITNDARRTKKIKSRIVMTKATFNHREAVYTSQLGLN